MQSSTTLRLRKAAAILGTRGSAAFSWASAVSSAAAASGVIQGNFFRPVADGKVPHKAPQHGWQTFDDER